MNTDRLKFRTPYYLPNPDGINEFVGFAHWDAITGRPNMMVVWGNDEQCTGMCDKNGNLVYDGDCFIFPSIPSDDSLYPTDEVKCYVKWYASGWYLFSMNDEYLGGLCICRKLEIISNIHEQKEEK